MHTPTRRKATQDYDDAHAAARAARDKIVLPALKTYHATTYAAYTAKQEALTLAYEARDKSGLESDDPKFSAVHDAAHRDYDDAVARAQQTYAAIYDAAVEECEAAIGAAYLVYREVVPEPKE